MLVKVMEDFITELSEVSSVDRKPKLEGNTMSCTLTPIKNSERKIRLCQK